jgi:hypothetical protein
MVTKQNFELREIMRLVVTEVVVVPSSGLFYQFAEERCLNLLMKSTSLVFCFFFQFYIQSDSNLFDSMMKHVSMLKELENVWQQSLLLW